MADSSGEHDPTVESETQAKLRNSDSGISDTWFRNFPWLHYLAEE